MALSKEKRIKISNLKKHYDYLKADNKSLLTEIFDLELPEAVYNSNAIENSSLSVDETKIIILGFSISREVTEREVLEAKNLAKVYEYIIANAEESELNKELILFLHKILMSGINDNIAGRFRKDKELINLGTHITPSSEEAEKMINGALLDYVINHGHFLEKITKFHLIFEHVHPFVDGNGRIGRALINYQLMKLGFPPIIISFKEKETYFTALRQYSTERKIELMLDIIYLALAKSLNKRITSLR